MLLKADRVAVSLPAKSLQEFATVLRNLEDERMRMVWPFRRERGGWWHRCCRRQICLRWVAWGRGHRGVLQAPVPLPLPRAETQARADGGESELGGGARSKSISNGVLWLENGQHWCW